jgi:Cu(I)/Ag(I) efflux system membrane fusion protein
MYISKKCIFFKKKHIIGINFKSKKLLTTVTAFLLLILFSCAGKKGHEAIEQSEEVYTCSMHPQVSEHQPGNCPICGMKLVKKNDSGEVLEHIDLETVLKATNEFVIAKLPVITAKQKSISIPVKAYGVVEYDISAAGSIAARVSGRIEKLYMRYRYQKVQAGQKIMEIYSPELVTAQQNFLFVLKNDADNASLIDATRQRLLLLGMSETELNSIIQTGKPLYTVSVYSDYTGHIHDAGMSNDAAANDMRNSGTVTQELSIKEGMYIQKGQTVFMIMNHHNTWAALQIFANDQSIVKKGDEVQIIPETDTAVSIPGKIDFIEPIFRNDSKTLTARVYFHNMNMLPVGSHVTANILAHNEGGLWIPKAAVLSLGMSEVVFMKDNGGFAAHSVKTGIQVNNEVQIVSGVGPQDTLAADAQYLVDSESFVKMPSP